jgi:uncharacterized membrane protein
MTQWARPLGVKITRLDPGVAKATAGVGVNMGLYNGFLAAGLLWSVVALGRREAFSVQLFFLSFIVIAGVVGAVSMRIPTIALFQSLPALVALGLLWRDRPVPATEPAAVREVVEVERQLLKRDEPTVPRTQHPKQHGCVLADFVVADDFPERLRFGVFKTPGASYPALIRYSNARVFDDRDPGVHGMAIKLMGVPGEKLLERDRDAQTQDFLLADHRNFFIPNIFDYADFESAALRAHGKPDRLFKLGVLLNYLWRRPGQGKILGAMQKQTITNPVETTYWSMSPYRLGPEQVVKYSAHPVIEEGGRVTVEPSRDMFKEALRRSLEIGKISYEFRVQLQTDPNSMPLDDPTVAWDESRSPFIKVATIRFRKEQFDPARQISLGDKLSFNPWHCLPEHEPLGGINRARKVVYEALSAARHASNHLPVREPTPETLDSY